MAVKSLSPENLSYTNGETGKLTKISIFQYQRPRPNAKLIKQPLGFIFLPLPETLPTDHYSMQIQGDNLGVAGFVTNPQNAGSTVTQLEQTLSERMGLDPNSKKGWAASVAGAVLATAPVASDLMKVTGVPQTAEVETGLVRNPHTAMLFQNVNLREFSFNWKLSPRNEQQSRSLDRIIKTIKMVMHPTLEIGGFALGYPNLVTIDFNNDKQGILNVDYAFISDFQVNPTPSGQAYYRNGYPVMVDMTMSVKEIRIKTAEQFGDIGSENAGGRR